jgi:HlyD family secretion protein
MKRTKLLVVIAMVLLCACTKRETTPGGSGFIEAEDVLVSAQAGGLLLHLAYDEGQAISAGDTIGLIDTTTACLHVHQAVAGVRVVEARSSIASLQARQASHNLALAQKEFDRVRTLLASGSANQQQYDQAETACIQARLTEEQAQAGFVATQAELQNAVSQVAILREQADDCFPVSPMSGVVMTRYADPGELMAPGRPLVKIASLDTVWVKIYLPPSDLTEVHLGGHARVDPENGGNQRLEGVITWISDEAEFTPKNVQTKEARADLVYAVKVTVPNPGHILKIGMPVSVTVP